MGVDAEEVSEARVCTAIPPPLPPKKITVGKHPPLKAICETERLQGAMFPASVRTDPRVQMNGDKCWE